VENSDGSLIGENAVFIGFAEWLRYDGGGSFSECSME